MRTPARVMNAARRPGGGLAGAVSFLTVVGRGAGPTPGALAWFPLVGAALGLVLGGLWVGAERLWPPAAAAALVVVADLALTGMLHLDGLVDSADGLLPPLEPHRRLEAMADPGIGAYGLGAGVGVLLLRWSALAAAAPSAGVLAAVWCASRTAMAAVLVLGRRARPGGLAAAFAGVERPRARSAVRPAAALVAAALLGGLTASWAGLAAVGGVVAGAAGVVALAHRRLGGYTGDVLGAAGVVGETAGLLLVALRW